MRKTNQTSVFRANANYANGNARDRQGRLVTCEHSVTRRITRTEKDGKITVLADKFEGKRLNAPKDIVVKSDDTIWFTDPLFGINGEWEGKKEKPEQATTNVYRLTKDGKLSAVITDIVNPNGLAFSPDEKKLYVVEWKGTPNRSIWSFDVNADGTVGGKTKLIDAADQGALDGFRVDRDGNLWCGWGSNGALQGEPAERRWCLPARRVAGDLGGMMNTPPAPLPIRLLNCCIITFGSPKNNQLCAKAPYHSDPLERFVTVVPDALRIVGEWLRTGKS
jgi:gluconolactonase